MKNKKLLLVLTLLLTVVTGCSNKNPSDPSNTITEIEHDPISKTEFMMDTVMTVTLYDSNDETIFDDVFKRLEEIEEKMSATIKTSEVNLINDNAGIEPVEVSDDVYYVLKEAKEHAEMSDGAYEPTIGPLVKLWNIQAGESDRDWIPEESQIDEAKNLVGYERLELLDDNMVFLKDKGMRLDLGGIVKGYAADEVSRVLKEHGVEKAMIDLGGNIFAHGSRVNNEPWRIGVQNPLEHTGEHLGVMKIENQSIVTSGDYERYFELDGKRYHHIISRITGYPSENEITGVTIVSDRSIDGDALSTTLFVLGVDKSMALLDSLDGVDAVFITKDKDIYISDGIKDNFTLRDDIKGFTLKERQ